MNLSKLTIRARITGGSLLIAVLISIVAGIVIFSQVQRIVSDGQSRVLENVEGPYLTALKLDAAEDVDSPGPGQLVAVVDPSSAAQVNTLPSALADQLTTLLKRPGETRTVSVDAESYLVRVTTVPTDAGSWSVITASRNGVDSEILNRVAALLVGSIAVINIAFGAASWFIGSAALSPVGRLRRSAAALASTPGDDLLPVGPAQDEIAELAVTLNELIGGLRASADRERQIVSDASHELRTPLAIIQTQLELAQLQSTTLPEMKSDVAAAQRTLGRLSVLATSLLELSRIDAQVVAGRSMSDELASELSDAADRGRERVGHRSVRIEYSSQMPHDAVIVSVSTADFGRVCDNLVNNALAAGGESGLIELQLSIGEDEARLRVADHAGGMEESFVPLAFDRFSRADAARSRGGAGLGLPIVAGIVSTSGGRIELDNRPGEGLTVEVSFPVA